MGVIVAAAAGVADCKPGVGPVALGAGIVGRICFAAAAATAFCFLVRSALEVSAAATLLRETTDLEEVAEATGRAGGGASGTTGATVQTSLHVKEHKLAE